MSERGEYRSISLALIDGPDFQRLPERARSIFLYTKMNLGVVGIGVWYPSELVARLSAQSGASPAGVQDALMTLEREGWIQREANVVWVVKQLQYDPHVKLSNPKHRKMVQTVVGGLPHLTVVGRFIRYYEAWFRSNGEASGTPSEPLRKAIDSLSDTLSSGYREAIESQERIRERDKEESLGSSDDDPTEIASDAYPPEFEDLWALYPKRTGGNSKKETHKAWRARLHGGVPLEVLRAGLERYRAYCDREKRTGTEFVKQGKTFFGPAEHYLELWESAELALHAPAPDRAEMAWDEVLAMLPAWQRREVTAEIHAALPEGTRRGLSKIGGFRVLAETPDKGRAWLRKDFIAAFNQTPTQRSA